MIFLNKTIEIFIVQKHLRKKLSFIIILEYDIPYYVNDTCLIHTFIHIIPFYYQIINKQLTSKIVQ